MNTRTTVILTIILALLASYLYFFEYRNKQEQLKKEEKEKNVLTLAKEKIIAIDYQNASEKVVFTKEGENWFLTAPVKYKANEDNLSYLIDTAVNSRYDQRIENPKNLADFGLKNPKIVITFKTAEAQETLKIGEKSPTGTHLYVMTDQNKSILLISVSDYYSFDKKIADLRNKDILDFEREKIAYLDIKNNKGSFSVFKEQDNWFLSGKYKIKADQEKVFELIDQLQQTKISDFVEDQPENLEKYGLDKPLLRVAIGENKESLTQLISVGQEIGDYNYAINNQNRTVFKINHSFFEKYKTVDSMFFRSKKIMNLQSGEIKKIEIQSMERKIVAEKKADKWAFIGNNFGLKSENIQDFVNKLVNLQFERTFSRNDFSLGEKIINVSLQTEKTDQQIKLTFGGITTDNPQQVYLLNHAVSDEGYAVNKNILEKIVR